jgi:MFS transporter
VNKRLKDWRNEGLNPSIRQSANPSTASVIPPTVKGLSLVSLFNDFASEMVYPLLPAFVTGPLGGGAAILGALDGAAELVASATKWWSGIMADRTGWRKPLVLIGYLAAVVIRPLIGFAGAAWQVVGLRVGDRLGKGLRTPARDALIVEATPPAIRGRAFGFHRAADHFGSIPGALLAWWLLRSGIDARTVLRASLVPGVVALAILFLVLRQRGPGGASGPGADWGGPAGGVGPVAGGGSSPDQPSVFWPPVIVLAVLVLCRLPETLILLRLQDLGIAPATIPLLWAALHLVRTVSSYPGGWLSDHSPIRLLVAGGGVVFAVGMVLLGQPLGPAGAAGAFLGIGLVAGITESAERVLVARLSPRRTGRGFGGYHAVTGVAALPAALGFGVLYQSAGGGTACLASAALIGVASIIWLLMFRRHGAVA